MIIDTHVHFWKYNKQRDAWMDDMKVLQQDYLPENLAQTLHRNQVDGVVAVQASTEEVETRFLVELAKTHQEIKGVVGWIDFLAPNVAERLAHFAEHPQIKGYRHIVQAEADDFLLREDFQRGIRELSAYNYTYDVLIFPRQLKAAVQFIQQFPDQVFILDHCAKPEIRHQKIDDWKASIKVMAQHPNLYCKLSGLLTEAKWKEWSAGDFYPYLDVVFDAFGTDRLLFGSDWPVILVSGMYVQWKSLLEKYMENFPEEEKQKVFGANAVRCYRL